MSAGNNSGEQSRAFLFPEKVYEAGYGAVSHDMKPAPGMNPEPWNDQPAPGSVNLPPYNSGVPPAVAAVHPTGMGDERPASRADMGSFFAEEDLYQMTPHVKVEFVEVFKEAEGANSFRMIANASRLVFKWTQLGVYRVFSVVLGILLVFLWGIIFALINFLSVFIMQPSVKLIFIILRPVAMLFKAVVRSFLDPLWQSCGLVFSGVIGRFSFNIKGLVPSQKPTQHNAIHEL